MSPNERDASPRSQDAGQRPRRRTRRTAPGTAFEQPLWTQGALVAGIDEVGRGAWAGPVSVGVVMLDASRRINGVRDSKMLTPDARLSIAARIDRSALASAVGHASNDDIDRVGMTAALRLAALRALEALPLTPDALLVDGKWDFVRHPGIPAHPIVKGDQHSASIAAASIVAKVARDAIMVDADSSYPGFHFAKNKGYPSPAHRAALTAVGPCKIHRHSWRPIQALHQPRLFASLVNDGATNTLG